MHTEKITLNLSYLAEFSFKFIGSKDYVIQFIQKFFIKALNLKIFLSEEFLHNLLMNINNYDWSLLFIQNKIKSIIIKQYIKHCQQTLSVKQRKKPTIKISGNEKFDDKKFVFNFNLLGDLINHFKKIVRILKSWDQNVLSLFANIYYSDSVPNLRFFEKKYNSLKSSTSWEKYPGIASLQNKKIEEVYQFLFHDNPFFKYFKSNSIIKKKKKFETMVEILHFAGIDLFKCEKKKNGTTKYSQLDYRTFKEENEIKFTRILDRNVIEDKIIFAISKYNNDLNFSEKEFEFDSIKNKNCFIFCVGFFINIYFFLN